MGITGTQEKILLVPVIYDFIICIFLFRRFSVPLWFLKFTSHYVSGLCVHPR